MKYIKDVKTILLFILLIVIVVISFKGCNDPINDGKVEHIIDTVFKEVKVTVPKYVPKWRERVHEVQVQVEIPANIDTAAILDDYYAKYKTIDTLNLVYTDTTNVERSFGYGIVEDVISENRIIERGVVWNYKIPTIYHKIIIHPKPKSQVYLGAMANVNSLQILSSASAAVLYKTKRDKIYVINAGAANNGGGVQPYLGGGIFWKVQIRKPKITDIIK